MRSLSRQEQKLTMIVHELTRVNVKTVANRSFTTEQSTSSTLGSLEVLGIVEKEQCGRESFYSIKPSSLSKYLQDNDRK